MDGFNSFERLVAGISKDERIALLKKLQESVDPDSQILESPIHPVHADGGDIETWLKEESFLLRIWLYIKALFSNTAVGAVYNNYLLSNEAKVIGKKYPGLFDYRRRMLLSPFYEKLTELKRAADFFAPVISGLENDPGSFYVFLGSLVTPDISVRMSAEADPEALPLSREVSAELRASMVRKMEEILQTIPSEQRNAIYAAIKGIEWLRQFVRLPFERFIASFSTALDPTYTCSFDAVTTEIASFARVLCNGPRICPEILESFYLFSADNCLFETENEVPSAQEYIEKAAAQVSVIKMFITTVPLRSLGCFAYQAASWQPGQPDGAEDWFVKYKARWKKWFDERWTQWLADRKKEAVRIKMNEAFGIAIFPLIPHRPWSSMWGGLSFPNEYALGFLYTFMKRIYTGYSPVLKILSLEGEFYQKDNRVEFTDGCNELNRINTLLDTIDGKLLPEGEYGSVFSRYNDEHMRTIQVQAKINALVDTITTETSVIIAQFCDTARLMLLILGGIMAEKRDTRYDSLINLTSIQGKDNQAFRKKLADIRTGFENALNIMKELETIAAPPGLS